MSLWGRVVEAEVFAKRAFSLLDAAVGPDHHLRPVYLNDLATLCFLRRDYTEAESLCERALATAERVWPGGNGECAEILCTLAGIYRERGKLDEAAGAAGQALDLMRREHGRKCHLSITYANNLGCIYVSQRKFEEAEEILVDALADADDIKDYSPTDYVYLLGNIIDVHMATEII